MKFRSLQTRFLLAGLLLVLTTVAGGTWSVVLFARLSGLVGETLTESQEKIDLTASLSDMMEREDDALLQAMNGKIRIARSDVAQQRQEFDRAYNTLLTRLHNPNERDAAAALREFADAYRAAGDELLAEMDERQRRKLYDDVVNPALRKAVAACSHIRELNFHSMQQVGLRSRNETRKAMGIAAGIALVAIGLSTLVMVRLGQVVLRPLGELTHAVEAIRHDDFKYRVRVDSDDELGMLAQGFTAMPERLGEYRESSLGELLLAKGTLEATVEALPDAVVVVDPDGRIVSRNALAVKVLQAMGGKQAASVAELPLPGSVLRDVQATLRNGQAPPKVQPDLKHALTVSLNGQEAKMMVTVAPIPDFQPHRAGAAIVFADVSDFARLDELRTEVVAVASHELKTPLTTLQMNLLLLQEQAGNLSARQREILEAALEGTKELGATIDELLDLTRIEAGQLQLARQRVDLAGIIDQVVHALRPRFNDTSVTLKVVKEVPWAIVEGDAPRLKIVFINLLTNALKYTPGGGEVTIRVSRQNAVDGGKPKLQIAVTDTGPGIPPELRERVFEKFFRVEDQAPSSPKGVRGTGIGLYLCREIIEAHGGTIVCTPGDDGRGTRIAIELQSEEN